MSAATALPPVFHRCACGRSYSLAEWLQLRDRGLQQVPACDGEPAYALRLRDCVCGSTRGVLAREEEEER